MKLAYSFAFTSLVLVSTALAAPRDYDGAWNTVVSCGPSIYNEPPYSYERRIVIADGGFAFSRERMLWNNRFNTTVRYTDSFTGRVENGVLTISGKGSADQADIPAWRYDFTGPATNNQAFDIKGTLVQDGAGPRPAAQNRTCTFAMKLAEPAAASLAGMESNKAAVAPLDASTISAVQSALLGQGLYTGTVDGIWGRGTEAAVKEWQRRASLSTPFDAVQAATLIQSSTPYQSSTGNLPEKERQLAQRERELAEREKRLEAARTNQQTERARQLADRQKQLDAKEQEIASQERANGVSGPAPAAPQAGSSPFIGSWCSLTPGGSKTKLDIHKVEGPVATGHYKYDGLPTQLDQPMSGTINNGVFRATIGNVTWTLSRKGNNLDGSVANSRTGTVVYLPLTPC